jgi:hypothetical protein
MEFLEVPSIRITVIPTGRWPEFIFLILNHFLIGVEQAMTGKIFCFGFFLNFHFSFSILIF